MIRIKGPQACKKCKIRARAYGSSRCAVCSKSYKIKQLLDYQLTQKIKKQINTK